MKNYTWWELYKTHNNNLGTETIETFDDVGEALRALKASPYSTACLDLWTNGSGSANINLGHTINKSDVENDISCKSCGCTEMLCGGNGSGCTSEQFEEEEQEAITLKELKERLIKADHQEFCEDINGNDEEQAFLIEYMNNHPDYLDYEENDYLNYEEEQVFLASFASEERN